MAGARRLIQRGRFTLRRASFCAWGLLAGFLFAPAWADGLQVSPVLLEFSPEQRALAIWLSNSGKRPLHAQARIQAWHQVDGEDVLDATTELVTSPPLVEIPPGQTQVVRVVRMRTDRPATEMSYRLLVDELPRPDNEATAGMQNPAGIRFLFRYSIPVFVRPDAAIEAPQRSPLTLPVAPGLSAQLTLEAEKQAKLSIRNAGPQRIKLSDLSYTGADGERTAMGDGLFGYVLASQTRQWILPVPASFKPANGTLKARLNDDSDETVLVQDPSSH